MGIMTIKNVLEIAKKTLQKIIQRIKINSYDDFTIHEYFIKQGAQIGKGCFIAIRDLGSEPYLIKIGNNVAITEGVLLNTHDGGTWVFREEIPDIRVFGPIVIEDNCLIGTNAQIFPGVTIGRNSIVGAGSVVITDVPANTIVMGVPARKFGSIEKYKEKCIDKWSIQKPKNINLENIRHWGKVDNRDRILNEIQMHLTNLFKDTLN